MGDNIGLAARAGFPALAAGALAVLLWSLLRRDKVPDLLRRVGGVVFERDGFCFAVVPEVGNGRCFLAVYYQSRYERPSRARVVLQPSKGFFLTRPDLPAVTLAVECPGAGFGVTRMPWAVSDRFQGKVQALDVAAGVEYPEGKGRMLRYRGGVQVGQARLEGWKLAATVAGALTGQVVLSKPARLKLRLPTGVFETVPDDEPIVGEILWQAGDRPDALTAAS